MKYIYKFLSLLTVAVLLMSSYASYANGCCCVKGEMQKAESAKSEMPCHKEMAKKDDSSNKSESGKCCAGKCDCKFTSSVNIPNVNVVLKSQEVEFSYIFFSISQTYNSIYPESLDAPPKA